MGPLIGCLRQASTIGTRELIRISTSGSTNAWRKIETTASRADHVAELLHEALGESPDRHAVLERFVGGVSADDAAVLRDLLARRADPA